MEILADGTKRFEFDREVHHFLVLAMRQGEPLLRFYGAALRAGGLGKGVGGSVGVAVAAVEEAAERNAIALSATAGALLIVDNWRMLHVSLPRTT